MGAVTKSVEERTGAAGGRGTLEKIRSWWDATRGLVREQVSDDNASAWATGQVELRIRGTIAHEMVVGGVLKVDT